MKKILSIILVAVLFISSISCNNNDNVVFVKCDNCAEENENTFKYCKSCGESLSKGNGENNNDENSSSGIDSETKPTNDVDFSSMTYVALGDSLTYGEDGFTDARMDNPYPELVKNILGLKSVQNCGISGDRVDEMYKRVNKMTAGAEIVSFMGGTNDCYQSVPLGTIDDNDMSTFYGRLNLLTKVLLKKYPNAFIFYMTPFKSTRSTLMSGNKNGDTLEDFAKAIKDVCRLHDIPCLDLYNSGKFELEMYDEGSDGIHPSQQFYNEHTAPQIAQFIREFKAHNYYELDPNMIGKRIVINYENGTKTIKNDLIFYASQWFKADPGTTFKIGISDTFTGTMYAMFVFEKNDGSYTTSKRLEFSGTNSGNIIWVEYTLPTSYEIKNICMFAQDCTYEYPDFIINIA